MAAPHLSLLLLLLTLLSSHVLARSSRMFSNLPGENFRKDTPALDQYSVSDTQEQEEANFINGESVDSKVPFLDETDTTTYAKYVASLPRTFNPEAYVTPEHPGTANGNGFTGTTMDDLDGESDFEHNKSQQHRPSYRNAWFHVDHDDNVKDEMFRENGNHYSNVKSEYQPEYQRGDMNVP